MAYRSVLYRKQEEISGGEKAAAISVEDAVGKVKQMAAIKADRTYKNGRRRKATEQTVDLVVHLGIDSKQADQKLRGAITLPKGLGKTRKVIAFCGDDLVAAAKAAGAVEAGGDEFITKVNGGWLDFDVAVAHPSMMGKVGKLGRVLGPQGKMPTPKAGTVSADIAQAVTDFSGGRREFRSDDGGNVHMPVGKTSFADQDLVENIRAVIDQLHKVKPSAAKGQYIKKVCLSATRTPGVPIALG